MSCIAKNKCALSSYIEIFEIATDVQSKRFTDLFYTVMKHTYPSATKDLFYPLLKEAEEALWNPKTASSYFRFLAYDNQTELCDYNKQIIAKIRTIINKRFQLKDPLQIKAEDLNEMDRELTKLMAIIKKGLFVFHHSAQGWTKDGVESFYKEVSQDASILEKSLEESLHLVESKANSFPCPQSQPELWVRRTDIKKTFAKI